MAPTEITGVSWFLGPLCTPILRIGISKPFNRKNSLAKKQLVIPQRFRKMILIFCSHVFMFFFQKNGWGAETNNYILKFSLEDVGELSSDQNSGYSAIYRG